MMISMQIPWQVIKFSQRCPPAAVSLFPESSSSSSLLGIFRYETRKTISLNQFIDLQKICEFHCNWYPTSESGSQEEAG